MGILTRVCSLIIWCSVVFIQNVQSQGYYYKRSQVNQYQIVNGKYELITTTTPAPTVFETFFPWMGSAYDSVRTPEEDAAILNSISDMEAASSNAAPPPPPGPPPKAPESDGLFSWFSIPGIPGFGSSESTEESLAGPPSPNSMGFPPPPGYMGAPPANGMGYPPPGFMNGPAPPGAMGPPQPNLLGGPTPVGMNMYDAYDTNNINLGGGPMMSSSQNQAMMLPPMDNHLQTNPNPMSQSQYSPSPNEIMNNVHPTFQFHQDVKDSIPIPSPSLPSFSQPPPMLPYAYSASLQYGTKGATNERPLSPSFIDAISSYFNFGKRSDIVETNATANAKKIMESRSSDTQDELYLSDDMELDLKDWASFVEKAGGDAETVEDGAVPSSDSAALQENKSSSTDSKEFQCPKSGIWRWNGEVCIAVGPIPVWACKPNDLAISGKIAICRNKIYFSPKVINKNLNLQHHAAA